MEARFYFHPENPQVRLSPHVRPIWARESDPFPPALSRGVQRDSLGPRIRNCRNTSASGWELESQITPCVDMLSTCGHQASFIGSEVIKFSQGMVFWENDSLATTLWGNTLYACLSRARLGSPWDPGDLVL